MRFCCCCSHDYRTRFRTIDSQLGSLPYTGDTTSLFPNEDDLPWFRAQAGRVWGNGNSLKNDKGRKPYNVQDDPSVDCAALVDQCTKDLMGIRMKCLKTCKVYLEDNEYYLHLKKLMSEE
jgi:hypothetical protein